MNKVIEQALINKIAKGLAVSQPAKDEAAAALAASLAPAK